jgi:hypothetical protein
MRHLADSSRPAGRDPSTIEEAAVLAIFIERAAGMQMLAFILRLEANFVPGAGVLQSDVKFNPAEGYST